MISVEEYDNSHGHAEVIQKLNDNNDGSELSHLNARSQWLEKLLHLTINARSSLRSCPTPGEEGLLFLIKKLEETEVDQ